MRNKKDVLYSISHGTRKITHNLTEFTNSLSEHGEDEIWEVVVATIILVRRLPPNEKKSGSIAKTVNIFWCHFRDRGYEPATRFYDALLTELESLDWDNGKDAQVAYQLLDAAHPWGGPSLRPRPGSRQALTQMYPRLEALIDSLVPYADSQLVSTPRQPDTGAGSDLINMLLLLVVNQTVDDDDKDCRAAAAERMVTLAKDHPGIGDGLSLNLLCDHPDRARLAAELINRRLLRDKAAHNQGLFLHVRMELLENNGTSFLYHDLDAILRHLKPLAANWDAATADCFTRLAFLDGQKSEDACQRLLKKAPRAQNLADWVLSSGHKGPHIERLRELRNGASNPESEELIPTTGTNQFQDLNFKLLVIEELMYDQKIIAPQFEIRTFAERYCGRDIRVEEEGHDLIPEAVEYFDGLLIPDELLACVEELNGGGDLSVYSEIFPFWDGEDTTFDPRSADDVVLLPNLKRMTGMPRSFVQAFGASLRERGVEVRSTY